ncbi:type II toxin-antitoxin system VapC family toxin [Isoptericola sp. NPDC019482]|uniref:type II toxin-antitoxin system VapC family toxin n=1 Tax=Isoptericola sp. NPDC019482 TaxID=3154688 RepID=UPI00346BD917
MYVLDTNVISAVRVPGRAPAVEAWLRAVPLVDLYTTALNLAEIEQGVRRKERDDQSQGAVLREWFEGQVLPAFTATNRVLPFDIRAARIFGRYPVPEEAPANNVLIAATAEAHGMVMVTRNVKHFEPLGVRMLNPWDLPQERSDAR